MPEASNAVGESDPIYARLEDQIDWYDRKSRAAQRAFKRIKVVEIFAAAVIPFLAGITLPHDKLIIAGLGVLITILEGILHLNQYQQLWGTYRSTCEALKHEKYLYLAKAGSYAGVADPHAELAERVESLVSQEDAKWSSLQQQTGKPSGKDS
ncbi:MAG TPA: DUF4231 domain-containing protein [Terracidiphilus sp.]|nr:DUF4231 domain-containing protein [Terracidiphilus sp.]